MKTSEQRVSVCVPVYNGAAFVAETLESALDQRHREIELLVSVDRSSDDSLEICRRFEADERVTVFEQPRRLGWVDNVNFLLDRVETGLYCILPHDDILDPRYLDVLLAALMEHPRAVLTHCDIQNFGSSIDTYAQRSILAEDFERAAQLLTRHLTGIAFRGLVRRTPETSGVRLRHTAHEDLAADVAFTVELGVAGHLLRVPEVLYYKRRHPAAEFNRWRRENAQPLHGALAHCRQCWRVLRGSALCRGGSRALLPWVANRMLILAARHLDGPHAARAAAYLESRLPRIERRADALRIRRAEDRHWERLLAELHCRRAELARHHGAIGDAQRHWEAASMRDPANPSALLGLSRVLLEAGDLDRAARMIAAARQVLPDDERTLTLHARQLLERGDLEAALPAARSALRVHPLSTRAHRLLARIHRRRGDETTASRIERIRERVEGAVERGEVGHRAVRELRNDALVTAQDESGSYSTTSNPSKRGCPR